MPFFGDIFWQPVAPPLQILGGAMVLALLAVLAYARTWRRQPWSNTGLLAMRLAVVAALAVILLGPSIRPPEDTSGGKPQLYVLLDTSGSMQTGDCVLEGKAASRMEFAAGRWLNPEQRGKLARTYDVRLYGFDSVVYPLGPDALGRPAELTGGRATRIAECVTRCLLDIPVAEAARAGRSGRALLVLSDGRDSDDAPLQPPALLALARSVPIYAACFGGPTVQRDLALVALPRQECLLVGEPGEIIAKVYQVALNEGKTTLHVRCGQEHVTRLIELKGLPAVTVAVPIRQDAPGMYEYQVSVDPVAGENETANNAQSVFCEVTSQRIRVLMLEGEPYWETKFLAQSLRKDVRIEFTQISQLSSRKQESIVTRGDDSNTPRSRPAEESRLGASTEPAGTGSGFARYDVIIIGRGIEHLLDRQAAAGLSDFVSYRGGHVIFARGQAYDAETPAGRQMGRDLAVIEPVVWGRGLLHNLSLSVTPAGRASPCFAMAGPTGQTIADMAGKLPGFTVMPVVEREKTATVVLASVAPAGQALDPHAQGQPGLVVMPHGRGKVVAVLGEGLWRWGILPPELKQFDGVYDLFWSNLIRSLVMGGEFRPGENVSLKLGRSSVRLGDPVELEAIFKFAPPAGARQRLAVIDPAGKTQELAPVGTGGAEPPSKPLPPDEGARDGGQASQPVTRPASDRPPPPGPRLRATFTSQATGVHRVLLEADGMTPPRQERKFCVYDLDLERLQTSANPDALRVLAEESGGQFFRADQGTELPAALELQQASRVCPPQPRYIWDTGLILCVILVWLGTEWLARRRAGLL